MASEKEKMLAGELYNGFDPELVQMRLQARELCQRLNHLPPNSPEEERRLMLAQLLGYETDVYITPPFNCDYGSNIVLGSKVYFNFNCVILDGALVTIGNNVLFGPGVNIYTAAHPIDADVRRTGLEFTKPITIEDDVWIGGNVVICPGVTIGARSVIGAGSVVTRAIPSDVIAAGNPCRIIRSI